MKINILFFGATADAVGNREIQVEMSTGSNINDASLPIAEKYPSLRHHKLLFAVNQEYCSSDQALHDGDELAIFTAVSGG
jgi:molybdopterin converting factor small subunit